MQVPIHAAKTNLSKLIEAAQAGEDVVIARGSMPVARLTPIRQDGFRLGPLKDALPSGGPDFLEAMNADDLTTWEGGA